MLDDAPDVVRDDPRFPERLAEVAELDRMLSDRREQTAYLLDAVRVIVDAVQ